MNRAQFFTRARLRHVLMRSLAAGTAAWCMVAAANYHHHRLTISGSPATSITAGHSYSFTPVAHDPYRRPLVFAIANKPSWATFSSSSGQLSGRPGAGSAGTYTKIVIAVSDGTSAATLPAFAVQVQAAPSAPAQPPVISGTAATSVVAGSAYSFQPSASDPGGNLLSFSVQNKPAWASFSIASGLLYGTPASTQTGTYANVIISASDGHYSRALPAFSITVTGSPATTGAATVTWIPPTQNTDGSVLTNLAGIRIHYGTSASDLTRLVQVAGTNLTSYTIDNLGSGTWYFGATAYTATGAESGLAGIVSKTIP